MAQTLYSWSNFPRSDVHAGDQIKVGQKVSRSDFEELSDEQFQELIDIGALREAPYPIPLDEDSGRVTFDGSPREYALQKVTEMDRDQFDAAITQHHIDPHLNARSHAAMEANEYDESVTGDEADEKMKEQESAEQNQETRKALEGRRPASTPVGSRPKAR